VNILIALRQMEEAGFKSIEVTKENGSWTLLDKIEALIIPEDLLEALANDPNALNFFENVSKSDKKVLLHRVISAKRTANRQKRISEITEGTGKELKPKQFRSDL